MRDYNRARSEVGWQHGGRERTLWLAASAAAVDDSVAEGVHVTGVRLKLSQKCRLSFYALGRLVHTWKYHRTSLAVIISYHRPGTDQTKCV